MKKGSKIIIAGTGRAGTSVLIQLLTNLGFNTGYSVNEAAMSINKHENLNAGIEHGFDGDRTDRSYIIKNPNLSFISNLKKFKYGIDHVYIPIRDLISSAKSRELMSKIAWQGYGGLTCAEPSAENQMKHNAMLIYNLVDHLESNGIPYSFISFPKLVEAPNYLFNKLSLLMQQKSIDYSKFKGEFDNIMKIDKVRFKRS